MAQLEARVVWEDATESLYRIFRITETLDITRFLIYDIGKMCRKNHFWPLVLPQLEKSLTFILILKNLISGCSEGGIALDLGSRDRAFESPHSDQKTVIFYRKWLFFITFLMFLIIYLFSLISIFQTFSLILILVSKNPIIPYSFWKLLNIFLCRKSSYRTKDERVFPLFAHFPSDFIHKLKGTSVFSMKEPLVPFCFSISTHSTPYQYRHQAGWTASQGRV